MFKTALVDFIASQFPFTFDEVEATYNLLHSIDETINACTWADSAGLKPSQFAKSMAWVKETLSPPDPQLDDKLNYVSRGQAEVDSAERWTEEQAQWFLSGFAEACIYCELVIPEFSKHRRGAMSFAKSWARVATTGMKLTLAQAIMDDPEISETEKTRWLDELRQAGLVV